MAGPEAVPTLGHFLVGGDGGVSVDRSAYLQPNSYCPLLQPNYYPLSIRSGLPASAGFGEGDWMSTLPQSHFSQARHDLQLRELLLLQHVAQQHPPSLLSPGFLHNNLHGAPQQLMGLPQQLLVAPSSSAPKHPNPSEPFLPAQETSDRLRFEPSTLR
jgi:hypothetical protein